MCAVDQKRPFFPRAGPFLDLLPLKGPFSLTGALTGPPYGKAPYGEASYGKAGPLHEAPYEEGRSLREGPGSRTGPSQRRTTKRLTGRPLTGLTGPPYGKAPYGEPSQEAPYEEGRYLREKPGSLTGPSQRRTTKRLTGRLSPYGKPLTRRDGPYGKGRSLQGPLRADRLTGRPLTGRLLTRRPLTNYRKTYGKLRGGTLPELGGNFRLCAVDQKRPFFPRAGPFLDLLPFKGPFSLTGALTGPPYGKAPYGEASYRKASPLHEAPYEEGRSLREGPGSRTGPSQRRKTKRLTGRPLTGRLLTRRPLTNYRKAYGKLWGGILPELGGNFRLCAVDQKRSFFPRVGPFLDLLPFKGPFPLTGALTGSPLREGRCLREGSFTGRVAPFTKKDDEKAYGKVALYGKPFTGRDGPYEKGRSLRTGPVLTERAGVQDSSRLPHKKGRRRGLPEGWALMGSPLREGPVPYGKGRGPLRVLHRDGQPLQEAPYEVLRRRAKCRSLRGWVPS